MIQARKKLILQNAALFALACGTAFAQSYPVRPVKFVVPFAPGVSPDVSARIVADHLPKALGQAVVIENMPGANGFIAAQSVARATPDGYTALVAPTTVMVNNLLMFKNLPYDPVKDFVPIQFINGGGPFSVSVNADLPIKTLPDLIAMAKAKPGAITYGVEMSSSVVPMIARLIRKRSNIDVVEVPYKTTGQLIQDVVAGRVNYTVGTPISADTMVRAGKLRIIAVTTANRFEGLPDVLTVNETIPGLAVQGFISLVAPVAMAPDNVLRLNRAIATTLKEPELKKRLLQISVIPIEGGSPEAVAEALRGERERWRGFVKELDIQPE
ncbi:MAG: Bug family tripartite tricarboxylate transporter substrate binding protein [Burkholderiales bacterium]